MTMTRTEFLAALEQLLASLPEDERKDALAYYEDYLDAAGPDNQAQAIAELGTPEEVARKILDEQSEPSSKSTSAPTAPVHPVRKVLNHGRMILGGCVAVLVLCLFFFQHSKATPVQPEAPASSEAAASSAPIISSWESIDGSQSGSIDLSEVVPIIIPADGLGTSTLNIPLEKLNRELKIVMNYGSVVFVTDPSLTSDKYATFQFDNFPHSPITRNTGNGGRTTLTYEMPENWQVAEGAPDAVLTITIPADALTRLTLDLEVGDTTLSALQLQTLSVTSARGSLYADDLTVTRDLEVNLSTDECVIEPLSGAKYANITAYRYIHLDLNGDPADYTIDARTDDVVRIGSTRYDGRYLSKGSKGDYNLSAKGLIDLNPVHRTT